MAARTRAELLLAAQQAGSDIAEQVRQSLLSRLPRLSSVQETAAHLGISDRRLRRQLQALGLTHSDLLQQCQHLVAERLLADQTRSLKQVADALGFASVSTFHRAFRRWAGMTPSDWRAHRETPSRESPAPSSK
jgi:AraC-like DNA-binding protein